jgi:hypothetical protein
MRSVDCPFLAAVRKKLIKDLEAEIDNNNN